MIVELKKDLCKNKTIEFIKRLEKLMCIQLFKLVTHNKYEFYDRQKNDFEL
jgi:hypothetical protein